MDKIGNSELGKVSKEVIDTGKSYIEDLFDRKGAPTPVLSPEGTETILKETILKETILKEDVIKGNVIKENVVKEDVIKEDGADHNNRKINDLQEELKQAESAGNTREVERIKRELRILNRVH